MDERQGVGSLVAGERFRLLHDWRFEGSSAIQTPRILTAMAVEADGVWVQIRTESGIVSLKGDDVLTVIDV
jgi:hypothetical protein